MKICYHCFHSTEESAHFCTFCGASLDAGAESVCPDAMHCGTTLYGRYLIGAVLKQDPAFIIYIARDSRTGETVAVKEYFPKQYAKRSSQQTVVVPEEDRDAFLEGKDLFVEESEKLSDEYDSEQPPRVQSYFKQNDTAYLVVDYGTPENLQAFLDGKNFLTAGAQKAADQTHDYSPPVEQKKSAATPAQNRDPVQAVPTQGEKAGETTNAAPARPFPDHFAPSDISSPRRTSAGQAFPGHNVENSGAASAETGFPAGNVSGVGTAENSGAASSGPNVGTGRTVPDSAGPDDTIPKESIRYESGRGGNKSSMAPFAIILAFLAACLIGIIFLVPRIFSGSQGSGRYIEFLFKRFTQDIRREAKKLERSTEKKQPFKGLFDDDDLPFGSDNSDNPDDPDDNDPTAEIAVSGITSSNFYNQGYYVMYEDECIYIDPSGLYRVGADSDFENSEKITTGIFGYLNEYSGHIYYVNEADRTIDCLDPDDGTIYAAYDCGTEANLAPESLYIYGDWGYFSHGSNLYRFNLEDTNISSPAGPEDTEKILNDFNANGDIYVSLCFVNGKLIYQGIYGITAVNPDGTGPDTISTQKGRLISDGKRIYCFHGINNIFKINLNGDTEQLPVEDKLQIITRFNCHGDWIYYTVQAQEQIELWKMKKDGTDLQFVEIMGADNSSMISFCTFPDSGNAYYYMITKQDDKLVTLHNSRPID